MKGKNKIYESITLFILVTIIIFTSYNLSFAEEDIIYIDSVEDMLKFSQDAVLDTYFEGKTIILNTDIDVSELGSLSIPTFAGTFDGQEHTISGISINESGSIQGLFRYLQEDGIIKNLNISADIKPSGSRNTVGGMVGNNKGTIDNCNFDGEVEGKNHIGGLVGINEASGIISNSSSSGRVSGEHFTGGIAGQNLGTILKSNNLARVNTLLTESDSDRDDINWSKINSVENINAYTDTGGIAGLSTGFIQDCVNRGAVGYKHTGYNVGGIVGRQSGYLSNCENYNTVLGRKDIGGIVGQIEPNLMLLFSEDILQELDQELNILQQIISQSFSSVNSSSKSISSEFDSMTQSMDQTRDTVQALSRGTLDHIDNVSDTVNISMERTRYTLEEIIPILGRGEEFSTNLNKSIDKIESGFDNLEITSDSMAASLNEGQDAIKDLRQAVNLGKDSICKTEEALSQLLDKLESRENRDNIIIELDKALLDLEKSFYDGARDLKIIKDALSDIAIKDVILKDPKLEELFLQIEELSNTIGTVAPIISDLNSEVHDVISQGLMEFTIDARSNLNNIFDDLFQSTKSLDKSVKGIHDTLSKLETTSEHSGDAFHDFSLGFSKLGDSSESMTSMVSSLRALIDSLASEPNIELPNISSEYRQYGEDLFKNIGNISSQINGISEEIKDAGNNLNYNIEDINDQIFVVFDLLVRAREDRGVSEYTEAVDDDDLSENSLGKAYKNQNYGFIDGDVNVGGITGSMAIEYDLDPEDDIFKEGSPSLNFKYLSTAIVNSCINYGKIESKKDYTGGIVGRMDLGTITSCENYGDIESREGDYVGGIAGVSYRTIDKSFVLSSLSGKDYVGGVAGYGNDISDSYTLVEFKDGSEWLGSIAGQIEGEVIDNYYVNDKIAGIDKISYSGKATPISYDELLELGTLPEPFTEFHLTFIADGEVVEEIPFDYGDSFDLKLLPDLPKKEGYEGHWQDFPSRSMVFNTIVEAVYEPIKTVISSELLRGKDDLPLALAEGKFNQDVKIKLSTLDKANPKISVKKDRILEAWNLELNGAEKREKDYTIRLLLPDKKRRVKVLQDKNDELKEIDSSIHGSYVVFSMKGKSGDFYVVEKSFNWIILIAIILIALIAFLFIRKIRNKGDSSNK